MSASLETVAPTTRELGLAKELIRQWRFRVQRVQTGHYESSRKYARLHLWLGLPAISFSTIVGTSIFATLSKDTKTSIQIGVGLLSVIAAVLTGLQTFLKYSELAERHRVAGAKFANLKHQIEIVMISFESSDAQPKRDLPEIEKQWDKLRSESPTLPARVWDEIEAAMKHPPRRAISTEPGGRRESDNERNLAQPAVTVRVDNGVDRNRNQNAFEFDVEDNWYSSNYFDNNGRNS